MSILIQLLSGLWQNFTPPLLITILIIVAILVTFAVFFVEKNIANEGFFASIFRRDHHVSADELMEKLKELHAQGTSNFEKVNLIEHHINKLISSTEENNTADTKLLNEIINQLGEASVINQHINMLGNNLIKATEMLSEHIDANEEVLHKNESDVTKIKDDLQRLMSSIDALNTTLTKLQSVAEISLDDIKSNQRDFNSSLIKIDQGVRNIERDATRTNGNVTLR